MQITKTFKFSYAHILPNHKGRCASLHGHNTTLEVTVDANDRTSLERPDKSDDGMVVDFSELKELVERLVVKPLDHRFLAKGDEWPARIAQILARDPITDNLSNDLSLALQLDDGQSIMVQIVELGFRTTAENLAQWVFETLFDAAADADFRVLKVVWWETDTGRAEYTLDDHSRKVLS